MFLCLVSKNRAKMSQSHSNLIAEYMQFTKYQRIQHLKALKNCFEGIVENRLLEGTYTSEEVEGILRNLCDCICSEVESEFISTSHMNVLLLKQLVEQAENVGLTLSGSISEMQNGDLLEKIRAEEMHIVSSEFLAGGSLQKEALKEKSTVEVQINHQDVHDCSVAHENLKKILSKKNEVIKNLRERLLQYEDRNE